MTRWLTIGQAAQRLDLAVDTVRRLECDGKLEAERTAGGHRRFREDVIEAFRKRHRAPARTVSRPPAASKPMPQLWRRPEPDLREAVFDDEPYEDDEPPEWEDATDDEIPPTVSPTPTVRAPVQSFLSTMNAEASDMLDRIKADAALARLKRLKAAGVNSIPYGVSASWRAKVIAEMETFVTTVRFPDWLAEWQAEEIVKGRVAEILMPQREEVARQAAETARQAAEAARRKEKEDREETVRRLIERGMEHARWNTITGWEHTPAEEAREEVEEALRDEVKPNWTRQRVEDRVDEILSKWDEEDD
jgi:excisionase family DNA binding protein